MCIRDSYEAWRFNIDLFGYSDKIYSSSAFKIKSHRAFDVCASVWNTHTEAWETDFPEVNDFHTPGNPNTKITKINLKSELPDIDRLLDSDQPEFYEITNGSEIKLYSTFPHARFSDIRECTICLLYTSPSPRDQRGSRMPSSA